jgi:membrane protease YdiL (CAAX protease family)
VAVAVIGPAIGGALTAPGLGRPAAPFLPWALVTLLVAAAEEGVLRGVLLDRIERVAGLAPAIALTTLAFALMHVPLYGWHVVPLDLAVGLGLGGLRLVTGRVAAPATAHAVADLATWWL